MPKHPDFTWTATVPDAAGRSGTADWCELVIDEHRNGRDVHRTELTREGGERLIEALHGALHPWAGGSILNTMWQELDAVVERLLNGGAAEDGRDPGRAEGMARMIAIMTNPYAPNVDEIRRVSMERQGQTRAQEDAPAVTDPQTVWLLGLGVEALRTLADTINLKGYRAMGKDRLVESLDQYDLAAHMPKPEGSDEEFDLLSD